MGGLVSSLAPPRGFGVKRESREENKYRRRELEREPKKMGKKWERVHGGRGEKIKGDL